MLQPISELLRAVDRELPRELVSARARKALRRRAAQVPSAWFAGCVECRLLGDSDQNDLLVYATRGGGGQKHLASVLTKGQGGEFGGARALLAAWARGRSLLARELSSLWLEYDLPVDGSAPAPLAFISLYPDYLARGCPRHVFGRPIPARRTARVAAAGLEALLGHAPPAIALELLEHCAACLPAHGRMFHVVAMPQRGVSDLRIGAIVPATQVRRWLTAVGWPGRARQLLALERLLGGGTELLHVQLELGDAIRPRLSIDFESLVSPSNSPRWHAFVERLVRAGCCERGRALAAVSWLKSRPVRLAGERLPLRMDQQLFFKVTSTPDSLEAKAYLLFQPRHALL